MLHEYLLPHEIQVKVQAKQQVKVQANLEVFSTCTRLIEHLPLLQHDERDTEDVAGNPHEITHLPEALRYAVMSRPAPRTPEQPANLEPSFEERVWEAARQMADPTPDNDMGGEW